MDQADLAQRLMATFVVELEEHTASMNRELLELEQNPPSEKREELLKTLFRSIHSLKGAAGAVNQPQIEHACHRWEDLLATLRDENRQPTSQNFSLLFDAVDALQEAGRRLQNGQDLTGCRLEKMNDSDQSAPTQNVPLQPPPTLNKTPAAAAPAPTPSQREKSIQPMQISASVRVAADKLDQMMAHCGELLVARQRVDAFADDLSGLEQLIESCKSQWKAVRSRILKTQAGDHDLLDKMDRRLADLGKKLEQLKVEFDKDRRGLAHASRTIDEQAHSVRMLPFSQACAGLDRAVRDVAAATGKKVRLQLIHGDVEVDRSVLESLKDPLLHLVRNAVDHGVELPRQRVAAGKPAQATVSVEASLRGAHVQVVVADDGRGLDLEKIREKVRRLGRDDAPDDRDLARCVFLPGFSTAEMITDISGRGVGLDVVQSQIESLHGAVDVRFEPGGGTQFILHAPLTLTTLRALMVRAGEKTYAIPTSAVRKLSLVKPGELRRLSGRLVVEMESTHVPISTLVQVLSEAKAPPLAPNDSALAVVLSNGNQQAAFLVDEALREEEITVKNLGNRIRRLRLVAGATLLPSGAIAPVLNAASLIRHGLQQREISIADSFSEARPQAEESSTRRLLVVDDSLTTRTLLKSILEQAGYEVSLAVDGRDALRLLEHSPAAPRFEGQPPFDVVIADVDMPHVDGIELTERIRQSAELSKTPVVLVTARGSPEDQARGVQAGADAYIVKSGFNQENLINTISRLVD